MGNTSVLVPFDVDRDGDTDVFAGSRSMPMNYGALPQQMVYLNDGKANFTAMPKEQLGPLFQAGMISGATALGNRDLVVVGEWMQPRIFRYEGNAFREAGITGMNRKGWWQTVSAADLDGDGDEDLVLANMGHNFYLKPDSSAPVKLWVNDFSNNVIPEKILTRSLNGRDVPVFLKRELTDQIPILKKQNLRHQDYAVKSIQDLFTPEQIRASDLREVNYASSAIAWNEGNGKFTILALPAMVQLSTVNAIWVKDLDRDGRKDLVLCGNQTAFQPQFARVDANYGLVLLNRGNRQWATLDATASGLDISGEVRAIREVTIGGRPELIFFRNNDAPVTYSMSHGK